jgi:succinyl-CoA synthetase beta subunit
MILTSSELWNPGINSRQMVNPEYWLPSIGRRDFTAYDTVSQSHLTNLQKKQSKPPYGLVRESAWGVALKVASPDILHKSDVGGVLLNLKDAQSVENGFETIFQNVLLAHPQACIQGVTVQPVIPPGQEVILGAVRDAQFGPLVMFGSGGVEVEGLNDVAFALAPLIPQETEFLLENTWAGRKLRGYRNLPPADRRGVIEILSRLAQLVWDFPVISEVEINPLRVLKEGMGVFALDARLKIEAKS